MLLVIFPHLALEIKSHFFPLRNNSSSQNHPDFSVHLFSFSFTVTVLMFAFESERKLPILLALS